MGCLFVFSIRQATLASSRARESRLGQGANEVRSDGAQQGTLPRADVSNELHATAPEGASDATGVPTRGGAEFRANCVDCAAVAGACA